MNLSERRPNTAISFIDAASDEVILKAISDARCQLSWEYHLYDSTGRLAAESEATPRASGLTVTADDGEILLHLPAELGSSIHYRLYNRAGFLMTSSDGKRTQIFGFLRMESALPPKSTPAKPQKQLAS